MFVSCIPANSINESPSGEKTGWGKMSNHSSSGALSEWVWAMVGNRKFSRLNSGEIEHWAYLHARPIRSNACWNDSKVLRSRHPYYWNGLGSLTLYKRCWYQVAVSENVDTYELSFQNYMLWLTVPRVILVLWSSAFEYRWGLLSQASRVWLPDLLFLE